MNWPLLVREILEEARREAGNGPRLAQRLEQLGVGGERGRYSESAVSNWIKGRAMPPADVLLAAASLASISVDEKLIADAARTRPEMGTRGAEPAASSQVDSAIQDLRRQIGVLQAQLIDLYARLGFPYPRDLTGSEIQENDHMTRRRAAGGRGA